MIGSTLGHYRVVQLLGRGGMGEVYLAEDLRLQRQVALKVLARELAGDPDRRERFEREARAVAALNHPNIVTIHAVEEADDILFLALELVDGRTLETHITETGLPLERLLAYAIPLTDAVGAAHQRGITHRDLKPANVMVTTDGRVKVLDFGLAKLKEDTPASPAAQPTAELTGEGRILGTAAYMSPEQAEGKAVDTRSDVFSLGVMLYEMSTGKRPFKGETQVSLISSIIKDTPASITTLKRDLPREFGRIVQRCLEKDPEDRYQTAKDLRNDLRAFKQDLESGELQPVPLGSSAVAVKSGTNSRLLMLGAAILIAVLGAAVALSTWLRRETGITQGGVAGPFQNVGLTRLTTTGMAGSAAISQDGKYVAYVVSQEGRASLWLRQVPTGSTAQIVAAAAVRYSGVSFSPDSNYIYYTTYAEGQDSSSLYQVPILGGGARRVVDDVFGTISFSPDRSHFVFRRDDIKTRDSMIMIADAQGGDVRALATRQHPSFFMSVNLAWSPDGKWIAAGGQPDTTLRGEIVVVDSKSGQERIVGKPQWRFVSHVAWMPDGRSLLVNAQESSGDASSQIWLVPYPDGEPRRITNDLNTYSGLSLTKDGQAFVSVRNDRRARIWVVPQHDESKAQAITTGAGVDDGINGIAWTPDGRILYSATAAGNADIWVMDPDGRNRVQLTNTPGDETWPRISADGKTIIFTVERDAHRELWKMDREGGGQKRVGSHYVNQRPSISPDGAWAYYSQPGGTPFKILLRDGQAVPVVDADAEAKKLPDRVHEIVPSPDGRLLAGHYVDTEQNAERIVVFSSSGPVNARLLSTVPVPIQWSADGPSLVYSSAKAGVWNLWRQPLAGGSPEQMTHFSSERIFNWSASFDERRLAIVRGDTLSDVVLVSQR